MNKPLILFIFFLILFFIATVAYNKYCDSKPNGCSKHEKFDENNFGPREGIDW